MILYLRKRKLKGERIVFDKRKFRARLVELGVSVEDLAKKLDMNPATLYRKMSGESDFFRNEIQVIAKELMLSKDDVLAIFFAAELAETQVISA